MFVNGVDVSPTLSMLTARSTPARAPASDDVRPHGDGTNALAGAGLSLQMFWDWGGAQPVPVAVLRGMVYIHTYIHYESVRLGAQCPGLVRACSSVKSLVAHTSQH